MLRCVLCVSALLHCASAGLAPATPPALPEADSSGAKPITLDDGESAGDQRRRLQAVSPGALDADICSAAIPATISNEVGTMHDDQTDTVIDCSQVRSLSSSRSANALLGLF